MNKPRLKFRSINFADDYRSAIASFVNPAILETFEYVVAEAVRRGRLEEGEVKLARKSPWILVSDFTNLENLYSIFHLYGFYKPKVRWGRDRSEQLLETDKSPPFAKKGDRLLIDQKIWEVIVISLQLDREVNTRHLDVLRENASFNIGFLNGLFGLDELGKRLATRNLLDRTIDEVMREARAVKEVNSPKAQFVLWLREQIRMGASPTNIAEVKMLPGFSWHTVDGKELRDERLRDWTRAAGSKLKGGRPKNKLGTLKKT